MPFKTKIQTSRKAATPEYVAREKFDYESLRPGQKEAIESVVSGRDTLVVMPTGAGKSAVYQIAAQLLHGPAVIVSPLIALQKDQVESLEEQDVGGAAVINSSVSAGKREQFLEEMESGELEYTFLTPEQLSKPEIVERVRESRPKLFVVDEAHCISEWGHSFRPDYLNLGRVVEQLGHPIVLALTATASGPVRDEIVARLGMREAAVLVYGFDRPNIWLGMNTAPNEAAKRELLIARIEDESKPGIVYVASRNHAEEIAEALVARGISAAAYHAGMTPKQRPRIQDDFMSGHLDVIVATSAFGMGVDKADVRFVFHFDVPHSIDSYYQEIGRAGRDGEPARALLFFRPEDLGIHKFFAGSAKAAPERLHAVASALLEEGKPVAFEDLREKTELSRSGLTQTLNRLSDAGALETLPSGEVQPTSDPEHLHELTEEAAADLTRRHESELERIDHMRTYAELSGCRREYILSYFGEEPPATCNNCDNCLRPEGARTENRVQFAPPPPDPVQMAKPATTATGATIDKENAGDDYDGKRFVVRSRVKHKLLGRGVVKKNEAGKLSILFDEGGLKTLLSERVVADGLLTLLRD